MATYKAEFLSHYYEKRRRPAAAYAMGFMHRWARLASIAPGLVNAITHAPGLSAMFKGAAGVATARDVPRFAPSTFVDWFGKHQRGAGKRRPSQNGKATRVIVWPDTFNNYFHPSVAIAATEVLEAANCDVLVPHQPFCCGRPLYDYGFLTQAKRQLRTIIRGLRPHLAAGTPIVVLEPSCLAVFRDELLNLFPTDEDAKRLSQQTFLLSEFLHKKLPGYQPPALDRAVMLHGHCHHKAIAKLDDEEAVLRDMGVRLDSLDSGCCGMAGSFGFEADHYDVSMKVGELVLLPAVRRATPDTLIVADGFSCREQIRQGASKQALHIAEVLRLAMDSGR